MRFLEEDFFLNKLLFEEKSDISLHQLTLVDHSTPRPLKVTHRNLNQVYKVIDIGQNSNLGLIEDQIGQSEDRNLVVSTRIH